MWQRDCRDRRALQPESIYVTDMLPPPSYMDNPINAVTTRFVKTATNKMRCPIFTLAWTPEGRRLVTGASSGEFTLWNGLTFNFETILQVSFSIEFGFVEENRWKSTKIVSGLHEKKKSRLHENYLIRLIQFLGARCSSSNDGLVT